MKLVIVESPTKAKTIKKFLGNDYVVESSYGHVRDLPKSTLGVDVEGDFQPKYVIPVKAKNRVKELKAEAKNAEGVILASDEDREGEAIAWHLVQALGLDEQKVKNKKQKIVERIVFHEITKSAIEEALENPREIDMNLVDAQQARRVLDRLVGYELSPFLWKKIRYGLSAGRVQSAAVRMIVDREREIQKFKPEEYHTISAALRKLEIPNPDIQIPNQFEAMLSKIGEKALKKFDIKTEKEAEKIVKDLEKAEYKIGKIEKKETQKNPSPPFTTSTLQQTASLRYGYSTKQTMMLAQQLYEGVDIGEEGSTGLITYMRTDSLNLSEESLDKAKNFIAANFGENYIFTRRFKTKSKSAQEAHEAIRPTDPARAPESVKKFLNPKQYRLYSLIWNRFIASQTAPAIFDSTAVEVGAKSGTDYVLKAKGMTLKFDGFLKIYPLKFKEAQLPELSEKENVELVKVDAERHFTEPPPRFNEASLIKALEENGIGRPSTYAPTITTILERGYVEKDQNRRFTPTEIGILVNDMLVEHFPQIVDVQFTAKMEEELDEIAQGKMKWTPVIRGFYEPFKENLTKKYKDVEKAIEKTDKKCPKCGGDIIVKFGRFGKFYACSRYPECKHTEPLEEEKEMAKQYEGEICEKCGSPMALKRGKFGAFLGCSKYPECSNIKKIEKTTGVKCPKCGVGEIIERRSKRGRVFYGCNKYPDCDFALWNRPAGEKCPKCGSLLVFAGKDKIKCSNKECN
ncbi:MAG: topoisomerase protein [Candidatus Azambacteria bacterium GW2011_GWA2_45_90]|uniref:DNA topoisomerase 1 n=1 Tax=Candidatus Azambacteria bacterium GW2011_GWA2_45_90 TaxID=1618614 RepID=A0A0G1QMJ8_9BACT|nr:MAG: topoisomerase protein [Candidatus Azambacteria bacterium GW2011_GWA2_45_90]